MRTLMKAAAVAGLLVAGAAVAQPAIPGSELLPEGPGREATIRVCSACHALEIVTQKRLDPNGWVDLVQMMRDRGAMGTDEEMAQIAAYLAKSFPAEGGAAAR